MTMCGIATLTVAAAPRLAAQQDSAAARLEERLDQVDQQARITARQFELYRDSVAAAAKTRASVSAGASGFSLRSADGNFQIRFRGYAQADGRFYNDDQTPLTDNFLVRRVRPIVEGTIYKLYDFRIMPDFAGAPTLFDAYLEARFRPEIAVRAGKFKPPLGLERLQSATDIRFAERGLPTNLVPSRDLGLQASGALARGVITYEAGVFNGVPDLANGDPELADAKDVAGRVFLIPFATGGATASFDLGIGIAGSTGKEEGVPNGATGLPAYRSPGQLTVFRYRTSGTAPLTGTVYADGDRQRLAPQAYLNHGPFGLLAEYTISWQAVARDTGVSKTSVDLKHTSWQVAGSWFLTGEKNSFKTVTPKTQFDPSAHTWGAIEIAARYGEADFDDAAFAGNRYADSTASVTKEAAWAIGVNWHVARNVKISLDYEKTVFTGGAATGDRRDETFLVTRFQTAF
jgi:phosphate-selective porin OprO/OprP